MIGHNQDMLPQAVIIIQAASVQSYDHRFPSLQTLQQLVDGLYDREQHGETGEVKHFLHQRRWLQ